MLCSSHTAFFMCSCRCSDENTILCLRVMVALVVVYDHIHPVGAFDKTTPFNVSIYYSLALF